MPEMPLIKYWVSHPKFTGQVGIDSDRIIHQAPPVWLRFMGQPFGNLLGWLRGLGPGLKYQQFSR